MGNAALLTKQAVAVAVASVFAFVVSWVLDRIVKAIVGLRVNEVEERVGLDISQHGGRAYGGLP